MALKNKVVENPDGSLTITSPPFGTYTVKDTSGVVENADGSVVIKAHGGDRAANLESIADGINRMTDFVDGVPARDKHLTAAEVHRINGWGEQLRIIADELRGKRRRPGA